MSRPRSLGLAAGVAAALLLTACGGDDGETTTTEGDSTPTDGATTPAEGEDGGEPAADLALIDEGTLTVCSDIPYAPFEFEDADAPSGFSGFDIDLMQEIADRLSLELNVLVTGFDAIESGTALTADTCDVAASAMTITEDREQNLNFSDPYYDSLQSLLVQSDTGVSSLDEFGGRPLGVQGATTGADFAYENAPGDTEIIEYPDDGVMWQAMQAGEIDGILQDLPVNVEHAQEEGYEIVEEFDTGEQYGFAVKEEGKEALLEEINSQLADLRDDGTYEEIYDSYFATE